MSKKIVVRLRKDSTQGPIVANSQVIDLADIDSLTADIGFFKDGKFSGTLKSHARSAAFIKTLIPYVTQSNEVTGTDIDSTDAVVGQTVSTIDFDLDLNCATVPVDHADIKVMNRVGSRESFYRSYMPSLSQETAVKNTSMYIETAADDVVVWTEISESGVYHVKVSDSPDINNYKIKTILINCPGLKNTIDTTSQHTTTTTTTLAPVPVIKCNFNVSVRSFDPVDFYERYEPYVINVILRDDTVCLTNYSIPKFNIFVRLRHLTTTDNDLILSKTTYDVKYNATSNLQIPLLIIDDGIIEQKKEFQLDFFLPTEIISSQFSNTPFYSSPKCVITSNNESEKILYPSLKWEWSGVRPDLRSNNFYCVQGQPLQLKVSRPAYLPPLWNSLKVIGHNGSVIDRNNAELSNGEWEIFNFPQGFYTNRQPPYVAQANILCYVNSTASGSVDYYEKANIMVIHANISVSSTEVNKGDTVIVRSWVKGHDKTKPVKLILTGATALNFNIKDIAKVNEQDYSADGVEAHTDQNGHVFFNVTTSTGVTSAISAVIPRLTVNYTVGGPDGKYGIGNGIDITEDQNQEFVIKYSPDMKIYPGLVNESYNRFNFNIFESQTLEYKFDINDVNYPEGREVYWRVIFLNGTSKDDFLDQISGNFNTKSGSYGIYVKVAPDQLTENNERFRIDFFMSITDMLKGTNNFWSSEEFIILDPTLQNILSSSQTLLPRVNPTFTSGVNGLIGLFQITVLIDMIRLNEKIVRIANTIYKNYEWTINIEMPGVYFSVEGLYYLNSNNMRLEKNKQNYNSAVTVRSLSDSKPIKINFITNSNKKSNIFGKIRVFASDQQIIGDFFEFLIPINN